MKWEQPLPLRMVNSTSLNLLKPPVGSTVTMTVTVETLRNKEVAWPVLGTVDLVQDVL